MREVRDSVQPYLMASIQNKEVSWKVLGCSVAKRELEEEEGKVITPNKSWRRRYGESQEFLKGAEGVTIYAFPKGDSRKWGKG